jgi:purine-binding chemotaxis protein CheW
MAETAQLQSGMRELALFKVNDMICGLDTSLVQEINKQTEITDVHLAPNYVRGVMNLRGEIATVIDLRTKFGLESLEINDEMKVVVVRQGTENIGLLVDSVSDVVMADPQKISPPPSNVSGVTGIFFDGIYTMENDLVAVLNVDELLKMGD